MEMSICLCSVGPSIKLLAEKFISKLLPRLFFVDTIKSRGRKGMIKILQLLQCSNFPNCT